MNILRLFRIKGVPQRVEQADTRNGEQPAPPTRARVLGVIERYGPVSEADLENFLQLSGNTVRPRIWELRKAGLVRVADKKGKTRSGRSCHLYEAVQ